MTTHTIICGDSRYLNLPDASVQLIVTSPPYPMIEMWDELFGTLHPPVTEALSREDGAEAYKLMHATLEPVWFECDRVLADGGFICINIGDAVRTIGKQFRLYSNHTRIVSFFERLGYTILPDIHWHKPTNSPNKFMGSGMYPAGAYVSLEHEYILVFHKGDKRNFTADENEIRHKSAYFYEERNTWFSDLWSINGAGQKLVVEGASRARSAAYPFEVPYRLVNMYSIEGDTVLDPFAGLGTTNLACMAAQRNSIGVELDPTIAEAALSGMEVSQRKLNKIIQDRLQAHSKFTLGLTGSVLDKCYENVAHRVPVRTRQEVDIQIDSISDVTREDNVIYCSYQ